MDRNRDNEMALQEGMKVALRKESVDRNGWEKHGNAEELQSLSARRAWIEIEISNTYIKAFSWSLSARRAWIEICAQTPLQRCARSLSARRAWIEI